MADNCRRAGASMPYRNDRRRALCLDFSPKVRITSSMYMPILSFNTQVVLGYRSCKILWSSLINGLVFAYFVSTI